MTTSNMRCSLPCLFQDATIRAFAGEGLLLWIKSDQACKPGLTLVSSRDVPLGT
jgi:hypothetical protein